MSKRPTDHLEPAAKKRGSERQLTKDDDEEEHEVVDAGAFQRASSDVLKQRKIIKARRPPAVTAAAAANPFAGIQLVSSGAIPAVPAANSFAGLSFPAPKPAADAAAVAQGVEAAPAEEEKTASPEQAHKGAVKKEDFPKPAEEAVSKPVSSGFGSISGASNGGFLFGGAGAGGGGFGAMVSGASGPAFGSSGLGQATGGFGSLAGGGLAFGASSSQPAASGGLFSFSTAAPAGSDGPEAAAVPVASVFGTAAAAGTSVFGAAAAPSEPKVSLPAHAEAVTTGEESERTVFSSEGALFEFDPPSKQWRERGRGEVRVNVDCKTSQGRLVMRQKGNLRLLMNANLWPEMQLTPMDGGKGVTFACVNHLDGGEETAKDDAAAEVKLSTFGLRINAKEVLDQFVETVNANKAVGTQDRVLGSV